MHCPKCGTENLDNAKYCQSCGCDLTDTSQSTEDTNTKITKLSIAAIAVFAVVFLIFLQLHSPRIILPRDMQKAQFHSIDVALLLFYCEFDGYPPSNALDPTGQPFCGAMKLCEAMMGQDLMGFHKNSIFRVDGMDANNTQPLYDSQDSSKKIGPFLPIENANAHHLKDVYEDIGPFDGNIYVLCDVYSKKHETGKRTGMPVLYYKADTEKTAHNIDNPDDPNNIYNYRDNYALLALGVPDNPHTKHPLFADPKIFYEMTKDKKARKQSKPYRADSYILLSAGKDGLYGTKDDKVNFAK